MPVAFIFGDSRVEGMQTYINSIDTGDTQIRVVKLSGKGLFVITTEVINTLKLFPNAKVIITAGICDCTFRNNKLEQYRFNFESPDDLVSHLCELYKDSYHKIHSAWPEARILYSELIGTDLTISKYTCDPLPGQQDILDEAIVKTNLKIVEINKSNNVPTPWISQQVHIPRKNGIHHQYMRLADGVHYDDPLKKACADRFVRAILRIS